MPAAKACFISLTSDTVSIAARTLTADEPDTETTVGVAAARAELGEKPGGAIGAGVQMTVVVNSVDSKRHIVAFTAPDGVVQVIEAQYEAGKKFVELSRNPLGERTLSSYAIADGAIFIRTEKNLYRIGK